MLSCKLSPAAVEWRDSGGGSGRSSRGQTPPPAPAAAVSAGLRDTHSPLAGPAWLLHSPPAGGAALHCNIPEHRDTVSVCSLNQAETHKPDAEQEVPEQHRFSFTLKQIPQNTSARSRPSKNINDHINGDEDDDDRPTDEDAAAKV